MATEQLRMLFAHTTIATLVATAFALVLANHAQGRVSATALGLWVALKVGVALPRIVQAQLYRLRGRPGTAGWHRWTVALLALDGACWGLGGAWVAGTGEAELVAVIVASLCSVAAVATFGLQVRARATTAYVLPMLLPMALAMVSRGDQLGWTGGVGVLLFLGLLLSTARRSERRLAEVFRLRFLMARVADERARALLLAQRESRIKTRFLATMSHELRTPLHGILGLTRLLVADERDAQARHRLGLIEHSGEHLLQLINDLLDLSRIEDGRVELRPAPFDLVVELEELVDIYLVRCQERGIAFKARIDVEPDCTVVGDATRLRQVMHNLLGNAVKFTERGEVRLEVGWRDADTLVIAVADTGPGIAPADLPHIFDAFVQGERAGIVPGAGAGLGLNIAREIAHAMKGELRCESELGVGTRFELTLPWRPLVRADLPQDEPPGAPDGGLPDQVLLAEDNDVNALLAEAMLRRLHCRVVHVRDGQAAVERASAAAGRPDVILMDCQMPVLDGLEATRRIRAAERSGGWKRVPVVALTANSASEDRLRCAEAGMDAFLSKPFTEDELRAVMLSVTGGRRPIDSGS